MLLSTSYLCFFVLLHFEASADCGTFIFDVNLFIPLVIKSDNVCISKIVIAIP